MAGGVRAAPQEAEAWEMREVRPWPAGVRFEDAAVGDGGVVRLSRPDGVRSGMGTAAAVCAGHWWAGV